MTLNKRKWLVTGATGSFGRAFIRYALDNLEPRTIRALSRDELKQSEMEKDYQGVDLLLGDVRDSDRMKLAANGIEIIVHAAALKRIEKGERDPTEFVRTNIFGTANVADAALCNRVEKALFISSDKAVNPANLYGGTKFVGEREWVAANSYTGDGPTSFVAVRYGNVVGSRGSVIPLWRKEAKENGSITITDPEATRFWLTMNRACLLVRLALEMGNRGEVFVPRCQSVSVADLAEAVSPDSARIVKGLTPGEKKHERLIAPEETERTYCYHPSWGDWDMECYVIAPAYPSWAYLPPKLKKCDLAYYESGQDGLLSPEQIKKELEKLHV